LKVINFKIGHIILLERALQLRLDGQFYFTSLLIRCFGLDLAASLIVTFELKAIAKEKYSPQQDFRMLCKLVYPGHRSLAFQSHSAA